MTPNEFKKIRLELGLSQTEMAKVLGYTTRAMISRLEGGSRVITPRMALTIKLLMENDEQLDSRTLAARKPRIIPAAGQRMDTDDQLA